MPKNKAYCIIKDKENIYITKGSEHCYLKNGPNMFGGTVEPGKDDYKTISNEVSEESQFQIEFNISAPGLTLEGDSKIVLSDPAKAIGNPKAFYSEEIPSTGDRRTLYNCYVVDMTIGSDSTVEIKPGNYKAPFTGANQWAHGVTSPAGTGDYIALYLFADALISGKGNVLRKFADASHIVSIPITKIRGEKIEKFLEVFNSIVPGPHITDHDSCWENDFYYNAFEKLCQII